MHSSFYWLLNQQYVSPDKYQLPEVSYMDRMIEKFSCSRDDQYNIEGAMGMPLPPFVASFSTELLQGNMLGVADEDGHVKLIDTSKTKQSSIIKEWSAHSNAVFDLAWVEKESKMVTASGDQTARLWDIEKCTTIAHFRGHTCSLKSIAVQPRSTCIMLTGARDGNIMLWDTRCNLRNGYHKPINIIHKAHELVQSATVNSTRKKKKQGRTSRQADSKQSVTAAVFLDDVNIISTGACDGAIKYWDIRKNYSNIKGDALAYHVINIAGKGPRRHGFSSLILNSTCSRLFAVCTNDIIYEFPTTNLSSESVATYQGHRASSFYVKAALSPDDRYLLCGSGDNSAYIWRTDQPKSDPWLLNGHDGEVTCVAWSPNVGEKLVTCSDDNTFKIWRLFQDNSDPLKSSGIVSRKSIKEDSKNTDKVSLEEDILELCIPEKKSKCSCNALNITSHRKVRVRWNKRVVQHAKDTIRKTSVRSKLWTSPSSFTVVTPKSTNDQTPNRPLRDEIKTSPSVDCQVERSVEKARTPKSSRVFMETWLKSPNCSPRQSPSNKDSIQGEVKFRFPTTDNSEKCRELTDIQDTELNEKRFNSTDENRNECHRLRKTGSFGTRSSPLTHSKKGSPARSKKNKKMCPSLDIKSMLTSMKRKCKSPDGEEHITGKRSKSEEDAGDEPVMCQSDKLTFDGKKGGTMNDKENIAKKSPPRKSYEMNMSTVPTFRDPKPVLKENPMQKEVRDVLDYAGEFSNFYS